MGTEWRKSDVSDCLLDSDVSDCLLDTFDWRDCHIMILVQVVFIMSFRHSLFQTVVVSWNEDVEIGRCVSKMLKLQCTWSWEVSM